MTLIPGDDFKGRPCAVKDVLPNRPRVVQFDCLWKIGAPEKFAAADFAGIEVVAPRKDSQERRLAGSIAADKPDTLTLPEYELLVVYQKTLADIRAEGFCRQHNWTGIEVGHVSQTS